MHLRHHPALAAAGIVAALALVAALAARLPLAPRAAAADRGRRAAIPLHRALGRDRRRPADPLRGDRRRRAGARGFRRRPRGGSAGPARTRARRVRRPLRRAGAVHPRPRQGGRGGLLLLRAVRAAVRAAARRALGSRAAHPLRLGRRLARDSLRGGRRRRVREPPAPLPDRAERQPALLPSQLALLRPQHLRSLPGADDGARGGCADVGGEAPRRRPRHRAAGRAVARAALLGLGVEHARAARRPRRDRRGAPAPARDRGRGRSSSSPRSRSSPSPMPDGCT